MSVFILEKLNKSFIVGKQENKVLQNINLEFPDKGLFSITGKSGSGKSTLLNILMGIEKPTSGRVVVNGKDISKMNDKQFSKFHLQTISIVFQHYNLFDDLSSLENVIIPLEMAGKNKNKAITIAKDYFKQFGMESLLKRKTKNLSGGEKQRVAIIRSLISNPKVILCDEPTGALDLENSREIMGILREISKNRLVIMVSHNKNLVNEFSDFIITLKDGKIVSNSYLGNDKNCQKNKSEKIKYSSNWRSKFIKLNLKKNFRKNIFSIIACTLSFAAMFLSFGFTEGSKSSQDEALKQNLSLGFATASESQYVEIEGSPLLFEKNVRPEVELIDEYFQEFNSIVYEENFSYFICNFPTCYFNDSKITNFEMNPLYDPTLTIFGKDMLVKGSAPNGDFEEIIINEEFADLLGSDALNKTLIISNSSFVNYQTGDESIPFIKETLNFTKRFKIVGIVHEFSFLNSPKIYFSYKGAKDFLKKTLMENVSNYLHEKISFYDYLVTCRNDDPVCSYSSYVFVTDINEIDEFFNRISEMKNDSLQITSKALETKETYTTFISSFSSALIIFVIIAFAGINFILGMISLSTFLENRKNTAILTCLGSRNSSIYSIYILENYLVVFLSFIFSIFTAHFLESKLNDILYQKFMFKNLISIPFKTYQNIPYGLIIILAIIILICSTLFTLIPMSIYRHNSITNELRDE